MTQQTQKDAEALSKVEADHKLCASQRHLRFQRFNQLK